MKERIRQLSQYKHRLSGTSQNSQAAQTIRDAFESLGFHTRCDFFRVPGLLVHGIALNILSLLIIFIFLKSRLLSLLLSGIIILSLWGELTFSLYILRRLVPSHKSWNIETCPTDERDGQKAVIVVAHYDTPKTGFLYNSGIADYLSPFLLKLPAPLNRFFLLPFFGAILLGQALVIRPIPSVSSLYTLFSVFSILALSVTLLIVIQIGFSRPSPGANDNGSGVLVLLELARRFSKDRPQRNAFYLLATGAEENGFFGIKTFMKTHQELDKRNSFFINIESVGGGELRWATGEEHLQRIDYPQSGLDLIDQLEKKGVIPSLRRASIQAPTDASPLAKKKFNVVTLIGLNDKSVPLNYHKITDTFDKLDTRLLLKAADIIEKIIRYSNE